VTWFTGLVLYALIWWTVLFAVLPVGTRPVEDPDEHTGWRGVPERPHMLTKVLSTTIAAAVLWGIAYLVISSDWLSFRHGWLAIQDE
jgi:predicted secreted protein